MTLFKESAGEGYVNNVIEMGGCDTLRGGTLEAIAIIFGFVILVIRVKL